MVHCFAGRLDLHWASLDHLPSVCCSIYNNITQLDIPTRRRQAATETPDSKEHQQQPPLEPDNGVPVYVMLPLDTVWLLERDGRKYSVSSCTYSQLGRQPARHA